MMITPVFTDMLIHDWLCFDHFTKNSQIEINNLRDQWLFFLQSGLNVDIKDSYNLDEWVYRKHTQAELKDRAKLFYRDLQKCSTVEELTVVFQKVNIPLKYSCINEFKEHLLNPRFGRNLVQYFFYNEGQNLALNSEMISCILMKKKEARDDKINRARSFILEQMNQCKNHSLKEVVEHFSKLHIDVLSVIREDENDPKITLSNTFDWNDSIKNEEFLIKLTAKWVDFQETTALLAKQGLKQILLLKYKSEANLTIKIDNEIENLAYAINEADIDYFDHFVIEFFEDHIGFTLNNNTKSKLKSHLEIYLSSEENFLKSFSSNRLSYLRI